MDDIDLKRDFKGIWIPKEVYLDERLSALEKMILIEIDSLDNSDGCFASNKYIADFCQCSETKVSNSISKLTKLGYLYVKSFDGRTRILQSCLTKTVRQPYKNCEATLQKLQGSNNIYISNSSNIEENTNRLTKNSNNIEKNNKKEKYPFSKIIDYLNSKAHTNYRATTEKTKSLIRARINEGFTLDDFKDVIDKKCRTWLNNDYEKYLRPETLFGTKFEAYLQEPVKSYNRDSHGFEKNDFSNVEFNFANSI